MRYGVHYKGSKNAIAKWIIDTLPKSETFVDLFCGGCAVTHAALLSGKYKRFIINDIDGRVPKFFLECCYGKHRIENHAEWISREDFFKRKDDDIFIALIWSFGNNGVDYIYGKDIEPYKKALHYACFYQDVSLLEELGIKVPKFKEEKDIYKRYTAYKQYFSNAGTRNDLDTLQRLQNCERLENLYRLQSLQSLQSLQRDYADVPYNVGNNFYGSNPMWYVGGDNKNGESKLAGKSAFYSDFNFNLYEYFHFCSQLMRKETKKNTERGRSSDAPCMIVFCSFEQIQVLIAAAKKHGFAHNIPLIFCKNYSPQVLKANMRICGATEYGLLLYRDKLPKFRNDGKMILNWFTWEKGGKEVPKIHPSQKPVKLLKRLINIFTDEGDVVIDPCAGSGSTGRACMELNRNFYGFEISKDFYKRAKEEMLNPNYVRMDEQVEGQRTLFDFLEGNYE